MDSFIIIPEVIPISTSPCTVVIIPDKAMSVAPIVVAAVGNLSDENIRAGLNILSCVPTAVLEPGDAVLYIFPIAIPHKVDCDVFPVITMALVDSKGVAALLLAIPEVPSQLHESVIIATECDVVVDGGGGVERFALIVVRVRCHVRVTEGFSRSIKAKKWPVKTSKLIWRVMGE